ncbi:catalase [Aspergillus clavatus NRRL 1]|uniref:Catalase n=1 Tax=Aspergillus clavatus (strain ATCC 1007 / CBS 513.65 / DSM 816 / NCTC 3887 / NRRL 1 / QM 1276 / 107) TaxID=344612 RepID=A1CLR9_ASPCL|nr:catalase, putative [Aspergillus clavatus NRRL 1]EAW09048.1 catalase, putative [Aspergillus clavatus NRRL 1]
MTITTTKPTFTLAEGQPIADPSVSTTLPTFGSGAITTLGDTLLLETLAHFNRERIPERVVHAKAAGAWGEFEVTNDISSLTAAKFLNGVGKKTPVLFRLSTTGGEKGSADTVRDVRGFSVKFFTEQGNHDIVGNHIPVFFVRDPIRFPSLNRSHKRHPATNRPDWTMFWDFHVNQPESVHALMHLFGSRGIPSSIRRVTGFGVHTFKLVAADGSFNYCKFHFRPAQSIAHFTGKQATLMAGANADFHNQDLWDAISRGQYPVWKLYVQVMKPEQAETYGRALFDITKVWPHAEFPLIEVGQMTLNKNPENYFAEIEQAAFSPSNMVPGIAMTPDPMLQARMFAYPDAQRYRLGVNYTQLPPNRAICPVYAPFERDGMGTITRNYGGDPNYVRSTLSPGIPSQVVSDVRHTERIAHNAMLGQNEIRVDDEDFIQPRELWTRVFDETERRQWVANVSETLENVAAPLRDAVIEMFNKVDPQIGQMMAAKTQSSSRL